MIYPLVVLAFDPEDSLEIKEVFANDLARTLWLAIKQGHLTDQHFNSNIIRCAKEIDEAKRLCVKIKNSYNKKY